jgi:hypothetical protein
MLPRRCELELEEALDTGLPTAEEIPISELRAEVATIIAGPRLAASAEDEPLWETNTRVAGPAPRLLYALKGGTLDDELARLAKASPDGDRASRVRRIAAELTTHEHDDGEDDDPTLLLEPAPPASRPPPLPAAVPARSIELLSEREIFALSAAFRARPALTRDGAVADFTPESSLPRQGRTNVVRAHATPRPQAEKTVRIRERSKRSWILRLLFVSVLGGGITVGVVHWHVAAHLLRSLAQSVSALAHS